MSLPADFQERYTQYLGLFSKTNAEPNHVHARELKIKKNRSAAEEVKKMKKTMDVPETFLSDSDYEDILEEIRHLFTIEYHTSFTDATANVENLKYMSHFIDVSEEKQKKMFMDIGIPAESHKITSTISKRRKTEQKPEEIPEEAPFSFTVAEDLLTSSPNLPECRFYNIQSKLLQELLSKIPNYCSSENMCFVKRLERVLNNFINHVNSKENIPSTNNQSTSERFKKSALILRIPKATHRFITQGLCDFYNLKMDSYSLGASKRISILSFDEKKLNPEGKLLFPTQKLAEFLNEKYYDPAAEREPGESEDMFSDDLKILSEADLQTIVDSIKIPSKSNKNKKKNNKKKYQASNKKPQFKEYNYSGSYN